ncbi:hypothetical protein [Halomarina pelagica]|uniref:hypothetical protein n=1 Tax=Halomarina pelagica TaxID=2961599 RepID=UPI0020C37ED8|nr:hypothetical protein [Halomarina sp. BND7]
MADDATEIDAASEHAVDEPLLARVPDAVVSLGAGALATATLITLVGTLFVGYSVATGEFYGFQPYEMGLALLQFAVATVAMGAGVHFARQRTRWTLVMVAAALGSLTFITIPFTLTAFVCVGLGKYHFASHTPSAVIRGE